MKRICRGVGAVPVLRRLTGKFARDERGVTAIEFAIAAPFLILIMLGAFEICFDLMMDATLQTATQEAGRAGLTTVVPTGSTRDAQAKAILTRVMGPWLKLPGSSMSYSTVSYTSYANAAAGTGGTANSQGNYGDVAVYTVTLTTTGMTGILKVFGLNTLTFTRSFMVQNEK
ncbi:TadE/TadG family type IV pilus assembly protein [Robbsia sp. KACC 23696]|uniref:TadE/TadG family type IV pilus assembly protein n=1 Tax=Robbsia sp. KACC 23696 TaxID=3149231 RepID=UPI00325C01D6